MPSALIRYTAAFAILLNLTSCKKAMDGRLKDAATTSSFKTGSFIPRTPSEFEISESAQPISTKDFIDRARKLTNKADLKLAFVPGLVPSIVTNGAGEQLLVTVSEKDIPTPQVSIAGNSVYSWHQLMIAQSDGLSISDLFVRWPYGQTLGKYSPADMFVRRMAWTAQGTKEPLLVPWLSHVKSETSDIIIFQAGNSILDARTGLPIMEFRRVENKPVWYVVGNYADKDISANTVFWRLEDGSYRSYTKDSQFVTVWKKQDDDSIDRVDTKPKEQEPLPTLAQKFLQAANSGQNGNVKDPLRSFDPFRGDRRLFQLERSKIYRDFSASGAASSQKSNDAFALTGTGNYEPADQELAEEDFKPLKSNFGLGGWYSQQTPLRVSNGPSGYRQARWEDSNGTPQGGTVLSQRNVFQPAGWFTKEKYVQHTTIKSPDGMIRDVDQYGNVVSTMSLSDYQARARSQINIDRMQRAGGVDSSVMRESNRLNQVSEYQLKRSESLLPGNTFGETATNIGTNFAVGQVKAQANSGLTSPYAVIGTGVVSGVATGLVKDTVTGSSGEKMLWNSGENFLKEGIKSSGKVGLDYVKQNPNFANSVPVVSPVFSSGIDTGFEAFKRRDDFNPSKSPDYYFDSQTSTSALFTPSIATGSSEILTYSMPKGRVRDSAKQGIKDTVETLSNETESYSRATRASTLEWNRSNALEGSLQRSRDANSAQEGLSTLERLSD